MNSRSDISETNSKQNDDNRNVDLLNQSDRKTTRSQKPRLDKINHVPMVKIIHFITIQSN